MKKRWAAAVMALLIGLSGCRAAEDENLTLTRVTLERGHGSMWGSQFYMDVNAEEILHAGYFLPEDPGGAWIEENERPITSEQWEQILSAVEELKPSLVPVRENLWKKLFDRGNVLDGTQYHRLTLYWTDGEECRYEWPDNDQAAGLQTLLEQLALASENG